jgi:BlaI family penicillinase repressor
MKTGQSVPRPSEGELEILNVLWEQGPCSVQQVHDVVGAARETGYTTILKLLQIMYGKGLVRRDETRRQHIYEAAISLEQARGHFFDDLLARVFSGSATKLVLHALSSRKPSKSDLKQIRSLLDQMEGHKK